jgi:hypothetical protein
LNQVQNPNQWFYHVLSTVSLKDFRHIIQHPREMTHADLPLGPKPIEGTKHGEAKCAELASPQNEWLEPGFAPLKNLICSFFRSGDGHVMPLFQLEASNLKR